MSASSSPPRPHVRCDVREEIPLEVVEAEHDVPRPGRQRLDLQVGLDQIELDTGLRGGGPRQSEGRRRDVDDRHVETPACQPHGMTARAPGDVQCPARSRQPEALTHHERRRLVGRRLRAVAVIPAGPGVVHVPSVAA